MSSVSQVPADHMSLSSKSSWRLDIGHFELQATLYKENLIFVFDPNLSMEIINASFNDFRIMLDPFVSATPRQE